MSEQVLDSVREQLRERCLIESPQLDFHFGMYAKEGEEKLLAPVLFLTYDHPLAAEPWGHLCDGDVLHFFFELDSVNIARVEGIELKLSVCVTNALKNYADFKAKLTQHELLNVIVRFDGGGFAVIVKQGIGGRYRVVAQRRLDEAGLSAMNSLIGELDATG